MSYRVNTVVLKFLHRGDNVDDALERYLNGLPSGEKVISVEQTGTIYFRVVTALMAEMEAST